jgi:hypothetical protein
MCLLGRRSGQRPPGGLQESTLGIDLVCLEVGQQLTHIHLDLLHARLELSHPKWQRAVARPVQCRVAWRERQDTVTGIHICLAANNDEQPK